MIPADAPIASLDPMNTQTVTQALRRIHDKDRRTVIANRHTVDTARPYRRPLSIRFLSGVIHI